MQPLKVIRDQRVGRRGLDGRVVDGGGGKDSTCRVCCTTQYRNSPESVESFFIILHPILPVSEPLRKLHVGK